MPTNDTRGLWRGKRVDNGEWVLGCLIRSGSKAMIFVLDDKTNRISGTDVDPSTIGECTGLRDKNGKLIFEGDFLESQSTGNIGLVAWSDRGAGFVSRYKTDYFDTNGLIDYRAKRAKNIGNIHDNPELLKGEANGQD